MAQEENRLYNAAEVSEMLGMSKPYAYKLIQRLNEELEHNGIVTIPGRIYKDYFDMRVFPSRLLAGKHVR